MTDSAMGCGKQGQGHSAEELKECPDCSCSSSDRVGQYIYYSTLVNLQACSRCGLIFSDKRIDSRVVLTHFEQAYKDETYFLNQRRSIFEQISTMVDYGAAQGASILDVGGAKGHLLAMLRDRRPDLHLVVHDLSEEACKYAAHTYGLRTVCGGVDALANLATKFDVIIMSDVIYYEPELRKLWNILPSLVAKKGFVVIRAPNKYPLIRCWQFITRAIGNRGSIEKQDHIRFFNPEHLYVFSRSYLLGRLRELAFTQVTAVPSNLLVKNRYDFWHPLYFRFCRLLYALSGGQLVLGYVPELVELR